MGIVISAKAEIYIAKPSLVIPEVASADVRHLLDMVERIMKSQDTKNPSCHTGGGLVRLRRTEIYIVKAFYTILHHNTQDPGHYFVIPG